MDKSQGFAMGVVLAAALLFRPAGSPSPQSPTPTGAGETAATATAQLEPSDGPWIASCNYWAPVRVAPPPANPPADIQGTIDNKVVNLHTSFGEKERKSELACSGSWFQRWGFPEDKTHVDVTALIAVTHDPVHTHMALSFDRSLDAILQAAADNGYVPSTYWLPWRTRGDAVKLAEAQLSLEPNHDPVREREPGLVVLRQAANAADFDKIVFLFLVGETTTQGVNGVQLQKVFQYAGWLKAELRDQFRTGRLADSGKERIAIIGPNSSASAVPLRAAIASLRPTPEWNPVEVEVAGDTGTSTAVAQLNVEGRLPIHYFSFGYDGDYSKAVLRRFLCASGYSLNRVAFLVEDNSFYGRVSVEPRSLISNAGVAQDSSCTGSPLTIGFPREISLLRNTEDPAAFAAAPTGTAITPYLRFSVKDRSIQDGVPIFSRENTPLSQEAQLMAIARELQRSRIQFVAISATNPLDLIFLAQFLHRAAPEATLVFWLSDLLTVRDVDSVPFVGSLAVSPYLMAGLAASRSPDRPSRTFPNSSGYAFYNAASYTFWHNGLWPGEKPLLSGYLNLFRATGKYPDLQAPPLWVSAIGHDGYYPLAILHPCSSNQPGSLPSLRNGNPEPQWQDGACAATDLQPLSRPGVYLNPARLWYLICTLVLVLCLFHYLLLLIADFHSTITRDLAIAENDQPGRRSLYIRVGSATLLGLALAAAIPVLVLDHYFSVNPLAVRLSRSLIAAGLFVIGIAAVKTHHRIPWSSTDFRRAWKERRNAVALHAFYCALQSNFYFFGSLFIIAAGIAFASIWLYVCTVGSRATEPDLKGLSFAYRCLNPGSGLSPLPAVVILLFGWYVWAFLQTRRLRFSPHSRPFLPSRLASREDRFTYVSDEVLSKRSNERPPRLYDYLTRLMTVRQIFHHFPSLPGHDWFWRDLFFSGLAFAAFALLIVFTPLRGVDHFLWMGKHASPYEYVITLLLFPLIGLCICGWLRMFLIWHTLKRDLLDRLEDLPIRFAFSRLKGLSWMTMLRRGGPHQQNRDIARSLESMHHLVQLFNVDHSDRLVWAAASKAAVSEAIDLQSSAVDDPEPPARADLDFHRIQRIEQALATFGQSLLSSILIPYWKTRATGLVQSKEIESAAGDPTIPHRIELAEEFVAIRYVSLIGAVLGNLRDLMFFVSLSFVLAFLAWNSYAFQPRERFDWFFTALLGVLGCGVITVFAQMHRNSILSRITDTKANELGWDFYFRIVSFGALPVLTWLAYQFPDIGTFLYRFVAPSVPVVK